MNEVIYGVNSNNYMISSLQTSSREVNSSEKKTLLSPSDPSSQHKASGGSLVC